MPAPARAAHALAMHGAPALPPDFTHFPYADPAAPKGGRLVQALTGTFDSLNPFAVKGLSVPVIRGYVVESLLTRNYDEPFTLYGLLAHDVETDEARSFVTFTLDPDARFSDGAPVTADDVLFSWELLRDKGRPNLQTYYRKVARARIVAPGRIRFDFAGSDDRELALILGLMPILPRHATDPARFEDSGTTPLIGSGAYVIGEVETGRSLTLRRNPQHWARDRPTGRGLWNFDEIRIDYYRDGNAQFEAFKRGLYDIRVETDPGRWHDGYDIPAVRDGRIVRSVIGNGLPAGLRGFVFNTRRPVFADVRVREALTLLLDFQWINASLYHGLYARADSVFTGSELAATGRAADATERRLLAPFPDAVRADSLDGTWQPPKSDGSGRDRTMLRRALALLDAAGYGSEGATLVQRSDRTPLAFEIMVTTREQERLAQVYARQLDRAGVRAQVRIVDAVQYEQRRIAFDFDMIENFWDQSLSPGNEQQFYWSSEAATLEGSRNYMGVRAPAADAMIAALLATRERNAFVSAVRALDRVLMSGFYVIPTYVLPQQWVAYSSGLGHPARFPLSGYQPETWWRAPAPVAVGAP